MIYRKVVRPLGFEPRTHRLKVYLKQFTIDGL